MCGRDAGLVARALREVTGPLEQDVCALWVDWAAGLVCVELLLTERQGMQESPCQLTVLVHLARPASSSAPFAPGPAPSSPKALGVFIFPSQLPLCPWV